MWSFLVSAIMMALVTAVFPLPYWCRPRSYLEHKQGETPEIIGEKVIFLEDGQDGTRILTEEDLKQLYTCERAEARLEAANTKINELEEELRVVINNMKSLEISEQEALQREDSYEATIRDLSQRLEAAETRAAEAESVVTKLQKEVDFLEDELLGDNLDHTFDELPGF